MEGLAFDMVQKLYACYPYHTKIESIQSKAGRCMASMQPS